MSKITYSFMQRFMGDLDTAIKGYVANKQEDYDLVLKEYISENYAQKTDLLPSCPATTDGTYVLKATVDNGTVTYSWVSEE